VFSISNSAFETALTAVFGLLGYVFSKLDCEPAPLLLGLILGPLMEENLRRALKLSRGDPSIFLTEPLSLIMLLLAGALLVAIILPAIRQKREKALTE
jgi:putative tricarboxylic transport membrane protein